MQDRGLKPERVATLVTGSPTGSFDQRQKRLSNTMTACLYP